MDIKTTCPLGSECETIRDNKIHRCAWLVEVEGKNPQSIEYIKEQKCAIAWMPILQIEMSQTNRGQTEAICSMRDESLKRQDAVINLAANNGKLLK